jgi:signal transduction histidine kinase
MSAWVKTLGWVAGVILLMSIAGSVLLKQQVNARTRQLRQINQEMEQRIIKRTAELAVAKEKAQMADQIKSAFLATMSHELRTPLNSIIGFTGIMLQGMAGPLNPEQHKQMSMVQSSARQLLALINDVLDISKIEAGQLTFSITSFDLRTSIEKMVKLISPLAENKGLDLKLDIADDITAATMDQRRLEQVILNLLNNAVKFTEKGRVFISCRIEDNQYCLSVSDTGIGIQPEHLQTIFQPFKQIDGGLTRKYEGTGLGLSICKKLMEMMGGSIAVESRWGRGSTFTIRFPIHSGA